MALNPEPQHDETSDDDQKRLHPKGVINGNETEQKRGRADGHHFLKVSGAKPANWHQKFSHEPERIAAEGGIVNA